MISKIIIIIVIILFEELIRKIKKSHKTKKDNKEIFALLILNFLGLMFIGFNNNLSEIANKLYFTELNEDSNIEHHINERDNSMNDELLVDKDNIPEYKDKAYVVLNNNEPFFNKNEFKDNSYEKYSELDFLGRCGPAEANIGIDLMPTSERKSIGNVKPTGWHTIKYDIVDGKYLYNRAHLIGFQLTGENANKKNLITGTRYLNVEGMLPFENMVADYIKETKNHVLYRVTPIYKENNLLASGVIIEAESFEDNGEGIKFNVFCYNVQPGIKIDYKTGESYKK